MKNLFQKFEGKTVRIHVDHPVEALTGWVREVGNCYVKIEKKAPNGAVFEYIHFPHIVSFEVRETEVSRSSLASPESD